MRRGKSRLAVGAVALTVALSGCGDDGADSSSGASGATGATGSASGATEASAAQAAVAFEKDFLASGGADKQEVVATDVKLNGDTAVVYLTEPSGEPGISANKRYIEMSWDGETWSVVSHGFPDSSTAP